MQPLSIAEVDKAFAVLEANGEHIPTAMRARVEMGAEMPFTQSQLEVYDITYDSAPLILEMLELAFAAGGLACIEHDGDAVGLEVRPRWALSPSITGVVAHHDGATTFGYAWERCVPISARGLRLMRARVYILYPLDAGEARELYTPHEAMGDSGEAERIELAKMIVAETGLAHLDQIERRFGITDMAAGAEIDRIAFAREAELLQSVAA